MVPFTQERLCQIWNQPMKSKKISAKKIYARGSIYKKGVWAVSSEQRFINSPHPCYNRGNENSQNAAEDSLLEYVESHSDLLDCSSSEGSTNRPGSSHCRAI